MLISTVQYNVYVGEQYPYEYRNSTQLQYCTVDSTVPMQSRVQSQQRQNLRVLVLEPSGPEARARVFVHVLYEFRDY